MSEIRYMVRGRIAKAAPNLNIAGGEVVWLTYTHEAGGWYHWTTRQWAQNPHPFETQDEAADASKANGPWYNVPAPDSIEIVEVDYQPARSASWSVRAALSPSEPAGREDV